MKSIGRYLCLMVLAGGLVLMLGCAPDENSSQAETDAEPTPSAVPEPTAQPTAVLTTQPTMMPALDPTADPFQESDKVMITDQFYYITLNDSLKNRITGMSYPADDTDCAIGYDKLRYIRLLYYDFDGTVQQGELIVNEKVAQEVIEIFYALYQAGYPFASIRLVDDFGEPADDNRSMAANNTSAFNYRYVTGTNTLSRHSYGAAIDINPMINPYIDGDRIAPENGAKYADRSLELPGMIDHDDLCYKLFTERGWTWGGDWSGDKDYQHFSKDLGY